jgi:hypothetical protein
MHSILIDPRDARHMYIGMSSGGVFETRDQGRSWRPLNQGCRADFLPDPYPEYGHDPHCVRLHPLHPDRLYQQNHCGIYRIERAEGRWVRIGEGMPKKAGDIGFPLVLHPRDPDTLWVFPMDGTTVWPCVSPDGTPAAYPRSKFRGCGGRERRQPLDDPDRRYPGIRFRIINEQDEIRRHIRIFVNSDQVADLSAPLRREDEIMIVCALSGG